MNADAILRAVFDAPLSRVVLDNGLTVLFQQTAGAGVVSAQLWVKTGSIHEGDWLGCGVSHALEHLVFKRSGGLDAAAIARAVQGQGGLLNAYTTYDRTVFHVDLPAEGLEFALGVLSDMVFYPEYTNEDFALERDVILREISMTQDDPDDRRARLLMECAFRAHPYRFPVIGYAPLFGSLGADDLRAYHRARYAPNNAVLVLVGAVSPARALRAAKRVFEKTPMRRCPAVNVPPEPPQLAPRIARVYADVQMARGTLAYKIPGLGHPDAPALTMLGGLLGNGLSSYLWRTLREEEGLVNDIEASAWNPGDCGVLSVSYLCEPSRRARVEDAVREKVEGLCAEHFSAEALAKVVRQAQLSEINARRSASTLAGRLGTAEVALGDVKFSRDYFARLAQLEVADVIRAAKTYLHERTLSSISVEPAPKVSRRRAQAAAGMANFAQTVLPNGVRLLLQPHAGYPKIHFKTASLGGVLNEGSHLYGATALGATLLARDTHARSAQDIAQQAEALGVRFEEYVGNNTFGLSAECLPCDVDFTVELLGQALTQAAFLPKTFATERKGQLEDLLARDDEIVDFGRYHLRADFFGKHPYAVESGGTPAALRALTAQAVVAHMQTLLCGKNLVVAVSGDFDPVALREKLQARFARLPKGRAQALTSGFVAPKKPSERTLARPFEQCLIMEAYPDGGVRAKNFSAYELLDELINGLSSRLFLRVREDKGLAYFVGCERVLGLDTGMFAFFAGTAPAHLKAVRAEIAAEIERLRSGAFDPGEIARCRMRLKAGRRMSLQTPSARAGNASLNAIYGLDPNAWRHYDVELEAVTPAQLAALSRRCFDPARRVALTVSPKS